MTLENGRQTAEERTKQLVPGDFAYHGKLQAYLKLESIGGDGLWNCT